jgi:hypothetical protein
METAKKNDRPVDTRRRRVYRNCVCCTFASVTQNGWKWVLEPRVPAIVNDRQSTRQDRRRHPTAICRDVCSCLLTRKLDKSATLYSVSHRSFDSTKVQNLENEREGEGAINYMLDAVYFFRDFTLSKLCSFKIMTFRNYFFGIFTLKIFTFEILLHNRFISFSIPDSGLSNGLRLNQWDNMKTAVFH